MPRLVVDIEAIGKNAEAVAALLKAQGLGLVAVTKGCLGEPRVAAAMLEGGAIALADTRDANLQRLRQAFPRAELHRIYLPSLAEPFEPGDISYVSSKQGAEAVAALDCGTAHSGEARTGRGRRVMLMVETGDEREGVPEDSALEVALHIAGHPRLHLEGVATNFACFRGRPEGVRQSVEAIARVATLLRSAGLPVERVSGGNSSLLSLLAGGEALPAEITELRCGEALLLGQDALYHRRLAGCRTDACVIQAEVVEEYTRSTPEGAARRLVLAVGRQDLSSGGIKFAQPGLREVGRSTDYLVVETDAQCEGVVVGAVLTMIPAYEALAAAWASPYVELELVPGK